MIKAKRLKKLLKQVPDDADVYAYEGESCGIVFNLSNGKQMFIAASESSKENRLTEGFEEESK